MRFMKIEIEFDLSELRRIGIGAASSVRIANSEFIKMGDFERLFENHASLAGLSQFASFLDEELDAAAVLRYLQDENSGFSGRKEFCEILGIGESTLSGWLKGDRIPKMAKLVIGLLKARDLDRGELEQQEKRVEELKIRDRVVKDGDRYMIVEFASANGIGHVIARDIPDEISARKLNSRYQYIDLLHEVRALSPLFVAEDDEYTEALLDQIEEALVSAGIKLKPLNSNEKFSFEADASAAESEGANADA